MSTNQIEHASAVTVSLEDLRNDNIPFSALEEAFGPESLGIIVVKDLPEKFRKLRHNLLSYSSYLASLPQEVLDSLESPAAKYLVGWSLGKETLKSGQSDTLKGSYYVNCHPEYSATQPSLAERYPTHPEHTAPNIWPDESTLPGFEHAFAELTSLIIDVAVLVARACDRYAEAQIEDYAAGFLERVVRSSATTKARLLHYFPQQDATVSSTANDNNGDDWCATHLDHGCLTGLTSAMFIDESANPPTIPSFFAPPESLPPLPELDASPDPAAGLYIRSRTGRVAKVGIPRDCLGFQTGEALQAITRGRFRAVPHFVKGARGDAAQGEGEGKGKGKGKAKVARNTLAVFTQPNLWEKVDGDKDFATFAAEIVAKNTVS